MPRATASTNSQRKHPNTAPTSAPKKSLANGPGPGWLSISSHMFAQRTIAEPTDKYAAALEPKIARITATVATQPVKTAMNTLSFVKARMPTQPAAAAVQSSSARTLNCQRARWPFGDSRSAGVGDMSACRVAKTFLYSASKGRPMNNFPVSDGGWLGSSREERVTSPQLQAIWGLPARSSQFDPSHPNATVILRSSLKDILLQPRGKPVAHGVLGAAAGLDEVV